MGEPSSPRWHVQYATFAFRIAFDFALDCFLVVVDLVVVVLGTVFEFSFAMYGSATTICCSCCCCCLMGEIVAAESCLPLTEEGFEVGLDDVA